MFDPEKFKRQLSKLAQSITIMFDSHKDSTDHDGRYYTKDEISESLTTKDLDVSTIKTSLINTSGELDLDKGHVFSIDASIGAVNVTFANIPDNHVLFITIRLLGTGPVTWPVNIEWSDGVEPLLGANWTIVNLSLIDGTWYGSAEQKN